MNFDNCGRPLTPAPDGWIDIPRVLAFQGIYTGTPVITSQRRVANASKYPFHMVGMAIAPGTVVSFRVKLPNGRYLSQSALTPVANAGPVLGPVGQAGNMLAFPAPIEIAPGARLAIENSGLAGTLNLSFWGFLRVPISALPEAAQGSFALQGSGAVANPVGNALSCLVGYPAGSGCLIGYPVGGAGAVAGQAQGQMKPLTPDDAASLRWQCNRNVMVPEWYQGNQCGSFVPEGMTGEPFTFLSDPITLPVNGQQTNVPLIVPGVANSWTDIRQIRAVVAWSGATGTPTVAIRLPNGYSVMGGDALPLTPNQWMPWFPRVPVRAGGRLLLDWGNQFGTGSGTITAYIEFDAVKLARGA